MTTLPAFNPFPARATTAVAEGPFLETYDSWAKGTPTLMLEPVKRLNYLTHRFLSAPEITGRRADGQAVYLHGEHGSGKTHAIRAGIGVTATDSKSKSLLPLYVKLSEPDFLHAYRLLMSQLSLAELTGIVLRFLGSLTRRGPLPLSVGEQVQRDPSILLELFDAHLVERGIILQKQADKLQPVVEGEANFQRALTYLLEPDLKDAAHRWLQAKHVAPADLKRLGISEPLQSFDECRYGLQLLTLLCTQAGRHLIIVLDQAEKFLIDQSNTLLPQSVGLLHRLVDAIPDIGGMLVVASNEDAWSLLPADLRQRFGSNDIPCTAMQPKDLIAFLGIYLRAALDPDEHDSYIEPWPFTDNAAEKLLRNSGGNLRRLLQLAWRAFDERPQDSEVIDADHIPNELQDHDRGLDLDRATVEMSIRRILWQLGPVEFAPRSGFDFALGLPNHRRLLIRLSEALFYSDEAQRAEEDVLARTKLEGHDLRAERCALIIIGYVSEGVRHLLEQAYDHILVYRDPAVVAQELAELVADKVGPSQGEGMDLPGIHSGLADLGWQRSQRASRLQREATELTESHRTASMTKRFDDLVVRWPAHRESIAAKLREARKGRAEAELAELYRVEQLSWRAQRFRANAQALLAVGAALASAALFTLSPAQGFGIEKVLGGAAAGVAVMLLLGAIATRRSMSFPEATASLPEVERIARNRYHEHEASPWSRFSRVPRALASGIASAWSELWGKRSHTYRPPERLGARDPYRRFGFVLTQGDLLSRQDLRHALRFERVATIRRALADRLGRILAEEASGVTITVSDTKLPELPYIVQHFRTVYWHEIAMLRTEIRLLIALECQDRGGVRESGPPQRPELDGSVIGAYREPAERRSRSEQDPAVLQVLRTQAGQGALGKAYGAGIVHSVMIEAATEVRDHELRRIQDLLSPTDGLGAFDDLELTAELERLYLFFEQLRFFRDGGALA